GGNRRVGDDIGTGEAGGAGESGAGVLGGKQGALIIDLFGGIIEAGDDCAGFDALARTDEDFGKLATGRGGNGDRTDGRALANGGEGVVDGGQFYRAGDDIGGAATEAAGATAAWGTGSRRSPLGSGGAARCAGAWGRCFS